MLNAALLTVAVLISTAAAALLKASDGLRRPASAVGAVALYAVAIVEMAALATRIPIALLYALWSGGAVVSTTVMGWLVFGERASVRSATGIVVIGAGLVVLSLAG